jgi:hypothetical protein
MISVETVTRTWERMSALRPDEAQAMVKQMSKEQPVILAYLLAASEHKAFDQDESQTFFYVGLVVWQIVKQELKVPGKITEKQLGKAEKANEDLLEKMASDSAGDFLSAAQSLVENYPEPEVLRYITEALMENEDGDSDNPPIRDENLGQAFLHLKIVLDAFIGNLR